MKGMFKLADHAAEYTEALIDDNAILSDYERNGMVLGAISPIQMMRVKSCAKVLKGAGGRGQVGTAEELGIPRAFTGGMREGVGGMLNPGKLSRERRALHLGEGLRAPK